MANEREDITKEALDKLDLLSHKSGWPDFLVEDEKNKFIFGIEVKSQYDKIRPDQQLMHDILARAGVPVITLVVWQGSDASDLAEDIQRLAEVAYSQSGGNAIQAEYLRDIYTPHKQPINSTRSQSTRITC